MTEGGLGAEVDLPDDMSGKDQAWLKAMELVGSYMQNQAIDVREDTEMTPLERLILPLLEELANDPFPNWRPGGTKTESLPLQRFIQTFDKRGKSLNRGSRAEIVQIFHGIFEGLRDTKRRGEGGSLADNVMR